jgi:phosphohistidine phosphatase
VVRVYLCRHAQAAVGEPDELRELTAEGVEQARALGARLAALPAPPQLVMTSPLLRARQTGAEIARETGATVRVEGALAPGATAAVLIAALADEPGPVATVGHQPDCSEIALAVLGRDPGFPVAGMAELELTA